jgi:catechol 2,3-dioxygenase-like lactoylglutathione lyase family enzyme
VFDHIGVSVSDFKRSAHFYRTVLGVLGFESGSDEKYMWWEEFFIGATDAEHPATQHLHVGFAASSRDDVDRFHRAGVEAGYSSDGEPGPRPAYGPAYYGAFLLDPDGNSVEAVHNERPRSGVVVDHLWIGVHDLARSFAFYDLVAIHAGIYAGLNWEDARQFRGSQASFVLVADGRPPTSGLHLAFPAPDRETVQQFHAAAVGAGYTDHGAPGVRPQYSPGYYGAFVLDPDGTNVESVIHESD